VIDRISERLGSFTGYAYLGAAVLIWGEVFVRYFLRAPTSWTQEVVIALCASAFLLGGSTVMSRFQHIRIGFVVDGRGKALERLSLTLSLAAGVVFLTGLFWGALWQFVDSVSMHDGGRWMPETTGRAWDVPLPPVIRLVLVVATVLFLVQTCVTVLRRIAGRRS
jgi:TRAP-type mannitol/chloroaromatic compound transport system permease small subunit